MIEISNKLLIGGERHLTILNLNNFQIENTLSSINGFIRSISSITDDTVILGIGKKELTLITCTVGSKQRVIVKRTYIIESKWKEVCKEIKSRGK